MSWLSTVSTVRRRAKEGILQAVGAHQATEDLEFDLKLKNFNDHVNDLNKVKDALELWIESFDTFSAATLMLSSIFHTFFSESPYNNDTKNVSSYSKSSENLKEAVEKLNSTVVSSVRQLFVDRCLQPANAMLTMIHPINAQISERKQLMLDFDSYRAKIQIHHESGRDSIHPKVIKTAMKLDESAKKLYALQLNILASFNEYERVRDLTFGPEFCSFIACFYHFSSFSADLSGRIIPTVSQTASSLYILESHVPQDFLELSSLPVVVDDLDGECKPDTLYPSLVLQRSEYAGGSYGGYAGYSVVLPETEIYEPLGGFVPTNHQSDVVVTSRENDDHEDDEDDECNKESNHLSTIESSVVSNDPIDLLVQESNNISQVTNEKSNIESNSFNSDVSNENNCSDPIAIIDSIPTDQLVNDNVSTNANVIDPPMKPPKSKKAAFSGNKTKVDKEISFHVTDSNSETNADNTSLVTPSVEINSNDSLLTESLSTEAVITNIIKKYDCEIATVPVDSLTSQPSHEEEEEEELDGTARYNVKITPVKPPKIFKTVNSTNISPEKVSPYIASDSIQTLTSSEHNSVSIDTSDSIIEVLVSKENILEESILSDDTSVQEIEIPEPPPPPPPPTSEPPLVETLSEDVIVLSIHRNKEESNITVPPTNTCNDNPTISLNNNECIITSTNEIDDNSNSSKLIPPKKPPKNIIPAKL